jgi:hypothetical protein
MSKYTFQVNKYYKRSEIKAALGLNTHAKGGPWDTGYGELDSADLVFCNKGGLDALVITTKTTLTAQISYDVATSITCRQPRIQ